MKRNTKNQFEYFKIALLLILIFILSILSKSGYGQIIERQLISTTGNLSNSANLQVSATSGEIVVSTQSSGTIVLTQGFQQPSLEDFVGTINIDDIKSDISISPNPTISTINIIIKSPNQVDLKLEILDLSGTRVLPVQTLSFAGETKKTLDFSQLPSNTYLLLFRDKNSNAVKVFKIIKTR